MAGGTYTFFSLRVKSLEYYQYASRSPAVYLAVSGSQGRVGTNPGLQISISGNYNYQAVPDSELARQLETEPQVTADHVLEASAIATAICNGSLRFIWPKIEYDSRSFVTSTLVPNRDEVARAAGFDDILKAGLRIAAPAVVELLKPFMAAGVYKGGSAAGVYKYKASGAWSAKHIDLVNDSKIRNVTKAPPRKFVVIPEVEGKWWNVDATAFTQQELLYRRRLYWGHSDWRANAFLIVRDESTSIAIATLSTLPVENCSYNHYSLVRTGTAARFYSIGHAEGIQMEFGADFVKAVGFALTQDGFYVTIQTMEPVESIDGPSVGLAIALAEAGYDGPFLATGSVIDGNIYDIAELDSNNPAC